MVAVSLKKKKKDKKKIKKKKKKKIAQVGDGIEDERAVATRSERRGQTD